MKEELISSLKIAEINFLMSLKEIKPEIVTQQIQKDVNHIAWIVGHCASHFDSYLSIYTDSKVLTEEEHDYYAYGVEKSKVEDYPFSFPSLLDKHIQIADSFLEKLETLPEDKFREPPYPKARESLVDMIKRITLHIMGHTGQIVLLRRIFDNPFWSFVGGVHRENREELRKNWLLWWNNNKDSFN